MATAGPAGCNSDVKPNNVLDAVSRQPYYVVHAAETIRGGIASYLREIVPRQVARYGTDRVAVIVPSDQLHDLGQIVGAILIGVKRSRLRIRTAWHVRKCLVKLLVEREAKIVHIHSSFAGVTCRLPPTACGRFEKLVYCPHGWAFVRTGRAASIARRVERTLAHRCDAIVCVSSSERDAALRAGLPPLKLHVIFNGLPDRKSGQVVNARRDADTLKLVFVGRLDRQKAFDVLIGALAIVQSNVDVEVFGEAVVGEYKEAALPANVHMHGWQSFADIEPYLLSSDALVMPSRWEALGISALEAMRAGKPVIASAVGGLVELVEDGVTGRLVPPSDAAALARVLDSLERGSLAEMGRRGRQRFLEKFQIEKCEANLAALYESL